MSKKLFLFMSLLVIASMVLAACKPKPAATAEAPEAPAPVETTAPEAPAATCEDEIGCVEVKPGEPIHLAYALTV